MSTSENGTLKGSSASVKIERMNIEKTRRHAGSETVYHVYFDLSGHPPPEWRTLFFEAWVATKLAHHVDIEPSFLVVRCQLEEVATVILPALKKAVTDTNAAYALFAQKEAAALEHREDLWREERERVKATAATLTFE
jgi:hypothetical protein